MLDEEEPEEVDDVDLTVELKIGTGLQRAVMDTAAFSLWVDATYFEKMGGILRPDTEGAVAVEGSSICNEKSTQQSSNWQEVLD